MRICILLAASLLSIQLHAQWMIEDAHSTAALESVHAVNDKIAWASGAGGAVVHTNDGGLNWQPCVAPKGASRLDLTGVQGADENTAVVISTGKGELSRVYKTVDGCQTWKLVFTNPDPDGVFKALRQVTARQLYLLGDPVAGKLAVFYSADGGDEWFATNDPGLDASQAETAGAGCLVSDGPFLFIATRGPAALHLYHTYPKCEPGASEGASVRRRGQPRTCPWQATAPVAASRWRFAPS